MDLAPGLRLRIVVPMSGVVNSLERTPMRYDGTTIAIESKGRVGYQIAHYVAVDARGGRVRLQFQFAETAIDGVLTRAKRAPALPFRLPRGANHIRLVYLTRLSSADHNMAVLAARQPEVLNEFTARFHTDPKICGQGGEVFCSWVPLGFAVRPER